MKGFKAFEEMKVYLMVVVVVVVKQFGVVVLYTRW
jgi:hypothetical protein